MPATRGVTVARAVFAASSVTRGRGCGGPPVGADGMPPAPASGAASRRDRRPAGRDPGAGLRIEEPAVGEGVAVRIRVAGASRTTGAPMRACTVIGAVPDSPFTTTRGLWLASRPA